MKIVDLTQVSDEVIAYINFLQSEISKEQELKRKAMKYIQDYCIDDEFYLNLSNKEKHIYDVLFLLGTGDDTLCSK